jgi:hypothetical protein
MKYLNSLELPAFLMTSELLIADFKGEESLLGIHRKALPPEPYL